MVTELAAIAKTLSSCLPVEPVQIRIFLSWFGVRRRSTLKVQFVQNELKRAGLLTVPDFRNVAIDDQVNFALVSGEGEAAATPGCIQNDPDPMPACPPAIHATTCSLRIASHAIENVCDIDRPIVSVGSNATLPQIMTQLLAGDYSQLPVLDEDGELLGIVSWQSIGTRMALGQSMRVACDALDPPNIAVAGTPIIDALPGMMVNNYVLIKDQSQQLIGILSLSDIALKFKSFTESIVILGAIDQLVRTLIDKNFNEADFVTFNKAQTSNLTINSVADMNFYEFIRFFDSDLRWSQLDLALDRQIFRASLERISKIRNDITVSGIEGVGDVDLNHLKDFSRLLELVTMKN